MRLDRQVKGGMEETCRRCKQRRQLDLSEVWKFHARVGFGLAVIVFLSRFSEPTLTNEHQWKKLEVSQPLGLVGLVSL